MLQSCVNMKVTLFLTSYIILEAEKFPPKSVFLKIFLGPKIIAPFM